MKKLFVALALSGVLSLGSHTVFALNSSTEPWVGSNMAFASLGNTPASNSVSLQFQIWQNVTGLGLSMIELQMQVNSLKQALALTTNPSVRSKIQAEVSAAQHLINTGRIGN